MPRAEDEAMAVAEAAPRRSDGSVDVDVYRLEYERRVAARQEQLLRDARGSRGSRGSGRGARQWSTQLRSSFAILSPWGPAIFPRLPFPEPGFCETRVFSRPRKTQAGPGKTPANRPRTSHKDAKLDRSELDGSLGEVAAR